ncbi:MAG: hypothetical protein LH628_18895 [Microcoleus sp. CAN_BIN18]|nr:hypothetical protein [Microcoleus sp. CAN_BIN18]
MPTVVFPEPETPITITIIGQQKEEGRRKKEEGRKLRFSVINDFPIILAVSIFTKYRQFHLVVRSQNRRFAQRAPYIHLVGCTLHT